MNELSSILQAWSSGGPALQDAVLATVVHVKGSAYRRPGARMLIRTDGNRIGTISGGCLENDVTRKAAWWTSQGNPALRTFDTSSEQAAWDFGLGCNGVITVLLERLAAPVVTEQFRFLQRRLAARQECVVATVTRSLNPQTPPGARLLWDRHGPAGGPLQDTPLGDALAAPAALALTERAHHWVRREDAEVFLEHVAPPLRLVVFGAGHDVVPVVAVGHLLGWNVTVADPRSDYARPERFPGAHRVVTLPASGELRDLDLDIDADTAVLMMTHNYPQDARLLPQITARKPRYLGLLGPRSRSERLFAEAGLAPMGPNVFAPVGLDIGSDHPESIALAIVTEVHASFTGRTPGFLRDRTGPIHAKSRADELPEVPSSPALRDTTTPAPACAWEPTAAYA